MKERSVISRKFDMPATLALLGATIAWGITPALLKWLALPGRVPDGFTANLIRYPVAAIVYLPWLYYGWRSGRTGRFWLAALLPTSINLVLQTLWAWSPYYLDAGLLAFLFRLYVVWAILGAFWLFPDERRLARVPRFWIGCVLAAVGFTIMSVLGLQINTSVSLAGLAIIFFCSITFGMYGVTVRYAMGKTHPLVAFSVISLYTSVGLIFAAPLGQPSAVVDFSPGVWTICILSALLGIACAHGLFYIAVQRIGVAICTLTLMAAPFLTFLCSHWWFGEQFTLGQWLGGFLLIFGSSLALWTQSHVREPADDRPPEADRGES